MKKPLSLKLFVLMACLWCAIGAEAAEAYACYTSSNQTLTFYYDNYRSSRSGTTYDLNSGSYYPDWNDYEMNESLRYVVFNSSFANARPTSTFSWFSRMTGLESITGIKYLNTSEVTNMGGMFAECCDLDTLDLSSFNTIKVRDMHSMFAVCSDLHSLDLSSFYTANVSDMSNMFDSCFGLTTLDLSGFNTANVTDMHCMFNMCEHLKDIKLGSFNTAKVRDMSNMFSDDYSLTTIYVGSGWTTTSVNNSSDMFLNCTSLVGGQGTTYNSSHVDKTYARIDGGSSSPGYLTRKIEAYVCYTSSNKTITFYYDNLRNTRTGLVFVIDPDPYYNPEWNSDSEDGETYDIRRAVIDPSFSNARPTTTYRWFAIMSLESITGLSYLNTSEVTNMYFMFTGCPSSNIDVSHFNTAKVEDMGFMFAGCPNLKSLNLSSFNTAKVRKMDGMFHYSGNLATIYVGSGWSTTAVTSAGTMFLDCPKLVGGKGTTYDADHVDEAYAHIDGGPSNPGYFTDINAPMAYACYTPSNTTLTFYYDKYRSTRTGTTYNLNTGTGATEWYRDSINSSVTRVVFNSSFANARPSSTAGWFYRMENLQSITGMQYLNTSQVTNMDAMFRGCSGLTSLNVSSFNTAKVTNMQSMFYGCASLPSLDLSNFNTANVRYMHSMFGDCSGLTSLNLSNFNTANVTSMKSMFIGCTSLTSLDVTSFNTANVTDMKSMFEYCTVLTSLDVSGFNTANVTDMSLMFSTCEGLTNLNVSGFNTANVTNMGAMFAQCYGLTSLDLSNFNTENVTEMSYMFLNCKNLVTIYAGDGWSTAALTNRNNEMFYSCQSLVGGQGMTYRSNCISAHFAHIDGGPSNPGYFTAAGTEAYACYTPSNTTLTFYYDKYRSSRTGTTYNVNEADNAPDWYNDETNYNYNVTKVVFNASFANARPTSTHSWFFEMGSLTSISGLNYLNTSKVTDMGGMFCGCKKLTSLDLRHFNTTKVTDMSSMFYECSGLTSLMLNGWDTSNVTDMSGMFNGTTGLKNLNLSHFNTAEVTDMGWMFAFCTGLTSLDVSNFNTANVTDMSGMFGFCTSLTSLDVSSFNTSGVNNMQTMFAMCSNLNSLDLSNFNTSNVKNMNAMFGACTGLRSLDLSNFNTSNVNNMQSMFMQCSNVTTVTVSNLWSTANVTESENMFTDCTKLVGGQGTTYSASHVDKAYAHIDGGPSNPGYFTDKAAIVQGDVNGNGNVNIADVTDLIDQLLIDDGTFNPAADCNLDNKNNISDVTELIDFLLLGRW